MILVNQIDQNDSLSISMLRRPLPAGEARLDSRVVSFHFQSQHFLLLFLQLTRSVRNDKSKHIHHSPRISSFQTTGPQSSVCSSKMWGIRNLKLRFFYSNLSRTEVQLGEGEGGHPGGHPHYPGGERQAVIGAEVKLQHQDLSHRH